MYRISRSLFFCFIIFFFYKVFVEVVTILLLLYVCFFFDQGVLAPQPKIEPVPLLPKVVLTIGLQRKFLLHNISRSMKMLTI